MRFARQAPLWTAAGKVRRRAACGSGQAGKVALAVDQGLSFVRRDPRWVEGQSHRRGAASRSANQIEVVRDRRGGNPEKGARADRGEEVGRKLPRRDQGGKERRGP